MAPGPRPGWLNKVEVQNVIRALLKDELRLKVELKDDDGDDHYHVVHLMLGDTSLDYVCIHLHEPPYGDGEHKLEIV